MASKQLIAGFKHNDLQETLAGPPCGAFNDSDFSTVNQLQDDSAACQVRHEEVNRPL